MAGEPDIADALDDLDGETGATSEAATPDADDTQTLGDETTDSDSSLFSRLTATEPNPPLESIDSPLDTQNWQARLYRAALKITGADDGTALEDLICGLGGAYLDLDPDAISSTATDDTTDENQTRNGQPIVNLEE